MGTGVDGRKATQSGTREEVARRRRARVLALLAFLLGVAGGFGGFVVACHKSPAPQAPAPANVAEAPKPPPPPAETPAESTWEPLGRETFLAPPGVFWDENGGFDVVVHFHTGRAAEKQYRALGVPLVVVSAHYGIGSRTYEKAFEDDARFGDMLAELRDTLGQRAGRPLHVRHLALVAWSAGYGGIAKVISSGRYDDIVDAVVLLDAPHGSWAREPKRGKKPPRVLRPLRVDPDSIRPFTRFADAAAAGRKTMVITHSSIVPPSYPSTETTIAAIMAAVGVTAEPRDGENALGMTRKLAAGRGSFHVEGFLGKKASDHVRHLRLVEAVLRAHVLPAWLRTNASVEGVAASEDDALRAHPGGIRSD
jgi:hypothetical protein